MKSIKMAELKGYMPLSPHTTVVYLNPSRKALQHVSSSLK